MTHRTLEPFEGIVTETLTWSIKVMAANRHEADALIREHWRDNQQLFRWVGGGDIEQLVVRKRRGCT